MNLTITISFSHQLSGWARATNINLQTEMNKKYLHSLPIVPIKVYENADKEKVSIIADSKGKAGIYR
jgi:hypothetical protein